jgi:hypothetical protein
MITNQKKNLNQSTNNTMSEKKTTSTNKNVASPGNLQSGADDALFALVFGKSRKDMEAERKRNAKRFASIVSKYNKVKDEDKYPNSTIFDLPDMH